MGVRRSISRFLRVSSASLGGATKSPSWVGLLGDLALIFGGLDACASSSPLRMRLERSSSSASMSAKIALARSRTGWGTPARRATWMP